MTLIQMLLGVFTFLVVLAAFVAFALAYIGGHDP